MVTSIHPANVATLLVIGALAALMLRHLMAWRLDESRSHLPWVLICATGVAFSTVSFLHVTADDPGFAVHLVRLQYLLALLLPALGLATMETLADAPRSRTTVVLLVIPIALAIGFFATDWFVTGPAVRHHDGLDQPFYRAQTQPGMLALIPLMVAIGVVLFRRVLAVPAALARTRRGLRLAMVVFIAVGANDVLVGAAVIGSLHLFQYGYLVFAIVASRFEAQRAAALRVELTDLVDNKQRELAAKQRSLESTMAELTASRARYQHLADATREGVLLCEGDAIVDANGTLRELLQTGDQVLAGRPMLELFVAADRARVMALTPTAEPIEVRCLRRDGSELAVSLKISDAPIGTAGSRVLLLRDLSEEKQLHRQLVRADRLAAIGTLAAGTAHEINNPLTYVCGNADLLGDELTTLAAALPAGATDAARVLLADLDAGTARIRRVVEQMAVLSKDRPTDEKPIDVSAAVELAVAMAGNQLRHRARVVLDLHDVPRVFGSEARLGQVLLNLVVNAAQAIPEDAAADQHEVRISTRHDRDLVVIAISDTGVGMTPEVRDRVFDPFFTTKAVGQGTGLGLGISLGIITSLGGRIDILSAPGRGTTIRVELPAMPAAPPAPIAIAPRAAPIATAPRGVILVVDDEPLVARTLARMLSAHQVEIATGGRDALARCTQTHYDVVVCDLMMPDLTGMELHAALADRGDATSRRFVFVTGGVFTEAARVFLEEPGRRWLTKPTSRLELGQVVDEVLAEQRGGRA